MTEVAQEMVRLEILKLLLKKPLSGSSIHNRCRNSKFGDIEAELMALMKEGVLIARDRRFFVRNVVYAQAFVRVDRRFLTGTG